LRYLSSVAEHGTIVGAAKALRLPQPSLSRQIRSLEQTAGVPLLERTRRGVRLTAAGTALLDGAHVVGSRLDDALRRVQLAHEGKLGTLRIGLCRVALASSRVGHAIAALRTQFPDIELDLTEIGDFAPTTSLVSGDTDLLVCMYNGSDERGIRHEVLFSEPIACVMVSSSHRLASRQTIELSELRDEPFVTIDSGVTHGSPKVRGSLREIHGGRIELHETFASLFNHIAGGRGWCAVPTALRDNTPAGVSVIPLVGYSTAVSMCALWRATDRSRLVGNALAVLHRACGTETSTATAAPRVESRQTMRTASIEKTARGLELRHLRALTVTVSEGSVNRAAARLELTQSGVSRRLHSLEREIGVPLFQRALSGIVPNAAGMVFHSDAVAILAALDESLEQARSVHLGTTRPCRIGALPNELTGDLLPGVIRQMSARHPEMPIEVTEVLTALQPTALRNRDIDVGLCRMRSGSIDDPSIVSVQIVDDTVECALVSTTHPLAARTQLTAGDLGDVPFIFCGRSTAPRLYDAVMQAFAQIGLTPRMAGSFSGPRALWRLTADDMGWTIGTRYHRSHPPSGLVAIPIDGLRLPWGVQLLSRRGEGDARVQAVLDAFRAGALSCC
jgi:DNA-binding transcriptional LysR family regulator